MELASFPYIDKEIDGGWDFLYPSAAVHFSIGPFLDNDRNSIQVMELYDGNGVRRRMWVV